MKEGRKPEYPKKILGDELQREELIVCRDELIVCRVETN